MLRCCVRRLSDGGDGDGDGSCRGADLLQSRMEGMGNIYRTESMHAGDSTHRTGQFLAAFGKL